MAAAGLGDGEHQLGPLAVRVTDGVARLVRRRARSRVAPAGSSTSYDARCTAGLDPVEVGRRASSRPAALLGLDTEVGALEPGLARRPASSLDADWRPGRVMRAGGVGRRDPHRHLQPGDRRHLRRRPAAAGGGAPGARRVRERPAARASTSLGCCTSSASRCAPWAWPTRASARGLAALGVPASFVEAMPERTPDGRRARRGRPRRCGSAGHPVDVRRRSTGWSARSRSSCAEARALVVSGSLPPGVPVDLPLRLAGLAADASRAGRPRPRRRAARRGRARRRRRPHPQRGRAGRGCSAPSTTRWRRCATSRPATVRRWCSPSVSGACSPPTATTCWQASPPGRSRATRPAPATPSPPASPAAWPAADDVAGHPARRRRASARPPSSAPMAGEVDLEAYGPTWPTLSSRSSTRPRSRGSHAPRPDVRRCWPRRAADRRALRAMNVIQLEHAEAIVAGAERAGRPVVLQISENTVAYHGAARADPGRGAGRRRTAPRSRSCVHLDHATARRPGP